MSFHKTGGNMTGAGSVSPHKEDLTIGDYIKRKEERYNNPFIMPDGSDISGLHADVVKAIKPKLTFEQWLHHRFATDAWELALLPHLQDCWKAAQENV